MKGKKMGRTKAGFFRAEQKALEPFQPWLCNYLGGRLAVSHQPVDQTAEILRESHAREYIQARFAVGSEIPRTSAASSMVRPTK